MAVVDRAQWGDSEWAAYLGCPETKVAQYREILESMFLTGVSKDVASGKYLFVMHRYDFSPSGQQRLYLMQSGKNMFDTYEAAVKDANTNIISKMYLSDFWERHLEIPAKAVQMMLIKQK